MAPGLQLKQGVEPEPLDFSLLVNPPYLGLTTWKILSLLHEGLTNKQVAQCMGYRSEQIVKNHVRRIVEGLGINEAFPERSTTKILARWWSERGQYITRVK